MASNRVRPSVDTDALLAAVCCSLALVAAYNYWVGSFGGTVVATAGAGITTSFLLLSDRDRRT